MKTLAVALIIVAILMALGWLFLDVPSNRPSVHPLSDLPEEGEGTSDLFVLPSAEPPARTAQAPKEEPPSTEKEIPPEELQLQRLQWELQNFRNSNTVQSARAVLCREALILLHDKKEYILIENGIISEDDKPGYYTVSRNSELGAQLFYISMEEYPEYHQVVSMDIKREATGAAPALSADLTARIIARVSSTLSKFGVVTQ